MTSKYNGFRLLRCRCLHVRFPAGAICARNGRTRVSAVGFVIGTPYSLLAVSDFLNGMAQEIIHYGILGHGSATVEPGWPHAQRFLARMSRAGGGSP